MSPLAPEADRAVRDAVDAFLCGALRPALQGATTFETKNSRYRLVDGVLESASDASLTGAQLVGWLIEGLRQCFVQLDWVVGARGVLVDPKRGRHIIVTSTSRVYRVDPSLPPPREQRSMAPDPPQFAGSNNSQGGSYSTRPLPPLPPLPSSRPPPSYSLPPPSLPSPSSTHGPLTPRRPIPACPPLPLRMGESRPIHAPPRRTGQHPRVSIPAMAPLPAPVPPPRPSRPSWTDAPDSIEADVPTSPRMRGAGQPAASQPFPLRTPGQPAASQPFPLQRPPSRGLPLG